MNGKDTAKKALKGAYTDDNAKWLKPTPKKRKLQEEREEAAQTLSDDDEERDSGDDSGPGSMGEAVAYFGAQVLSLTRKEQHCCDAYETHCTVLASQCTVCTQFTSDASRLGLSAMLLCMHLQAETKATATWVLCQMK